MEYRNVEFKCCNKYPNQGTPLGRIPDPRQPSRSSEEAQRPRRPVSAQEASAPRRARRRRWAAPSLRPRSWSALPIRRQNAFKEPGWRAPGARRPLSQCSSSGRTRSHAEHGCRRSGQPLPPSFPPKACGYSGPSIEAGPAPRCSPKPLGCLGPAARRPEALAVLWQGEGLELADSSNVSGSWLHN